MKTDRKARAQQLASDIYASTSAEALAVKELAVLMVEEARTSMVEADGDDILRHQGAARAFKRFHDLLTRKPLQVKEQ